MTVYETSVDQAEVPVLNVASQQNHFYYPFTCLIKLLLINKYFLVVNYCLKYIFIALCDDIGGILAQIIGFP